MIAWSCPERDPGRRLSLPRELRTRPGAVVCDSWGVLCAFQKLDREGRELDSPGGLASPPGSSRVLQGPSRIVFQGPGTLETWPSTPPGLRPNKMGSSGQTRGFVRRTPRANRRNHVAANPVRCSSEPLLMWTSIRMNAGGHKNHHPVLMIRTRHAYTAVYAKPGWVGGF